MIEIIYQIVIGLFIFFAGVTAGIVILVKIMDKNKIKVCKGCK